MQSSGICPPIAMSADIFSLANNTPWPHVNPWGVVTAFSDGHAEFVEVGYQTYCRFAEVVTIENRDQLSAVFWTALDRRDFSILP